MLYDIILIKRNRVWKGKRVNNGRIFIFWVYCPFKTYTTIQKFGVSKIFFKEIIIFIKQRCITLIKCGSTDKFLFQINYVLNSLLIKESWSN